MHVCYTQGRKKVMKALEREMEDRLAAEAGSRQFRQQDLLDLLVQEMRKDGNTLTKEVAVEYIFLLLFASLQTTPMATALAVKLLTENPDVLEKLTKEHDEIRSQMNEERPWISWEEYRSMTYTAMVIKEVLRFAAPFLLRKSLEDVNVKGYTIPKGCPVVLHLPSVHMDPHLFPDSASFNPSRWEQPASGGMNGYMPFGGGRRLCLGMDFGKLYITIFLHHLVTKYRWKAMKGSGEVIQRPLVEFPKGFHVQMFPRTAPGGL